MPPTPLILNEWVICDLTCENGEECQKETYEFLARVARKRDYLVLLHGSPWMHKAYRFVKVAGRDQNLRRLSKFLFRTFILDPSKGKMFISGDIPSMPRELESIVSADDSYLVALCLAVPESIIVTTDTKLMAALRDVPGINIQSRHQFLGHYL
jgi:hypothetical protein